MLNSQIQIHRILGFGATSTKKQRKPGGDKPARETRKSTNTPRGSRQSTTAHLSHLILIQFSFLWSEEFVHNNFIFVENPIMKFLTAVLLLLLSYASSSCLQCGARLRSCCYAQSHRLVFSSFFFDGNVVFILTSVIITQSLCNFLLIEPIFYSLWQC